MSSRLDKFSGKMIRIRSREQSGGPRYSARSGGLATAPTTSFTPGVRFGARLPTTRSGNVQSPITTNISVLFPNADFIKSIQRFERRVLYKTARYAQRTYRSTLKRKPPRMFTPASYRDSNIGRPKRHTSRYKKEVIGGASRPPYLRTGKLKNQVNFQVDLRRNSFVAGPPLDKSLSAYEKTRPLVANGAIPGLLDQGGPAMVRITKRRKGPDGKWASRYYVWEKRVYRAFPYKKNAFVKSTAFMKRIIPEEKLKV